MVWLTEAMTPSLISCLTTSAPVFFMRLASSPTEISSGMWTVSGAFLAISSWRRRIFSCSSLRDLEPTKPPFVFLFWLRFCLLPMRCLPPVMFCTRSETSSSTWSSKRAALTCAAEVSTTRRSRWRCGWGCLAGLGCCGCAAVWSLAACWGAAVWGLRAAGCAGAAGAACAGAADAAGAAGASSSTTSTGSSAGFSFFCAAAAKT